MRMRLPLLVVACIAVTACPPTSGPAPEAGNVIHRALDNRINRYPCDEDPEGTPPTAVNALVGDNDFQNEIHDCQRLVTGDPVLGGAEFGPLVGIFPLQSQLSLPDADYTTPRVVATIYSWDGYDGPEEYDALGIRPGWSCLWVQRMPGTWRAAIMQADTMTAGCAEPQPNVVGILSWNLEGSAHDYAGTEEYPPTARWSWDANADSHYIEVRCGSRWCTFGAPGFRPRHEGRYGNLSRDSVPGWYDEQHLGVSGGNERLVPGPWARIGPSAEYATARKHGESAIEQAFIDGLVAADMDFAISPASNLYRDKLYLGASAGGGLRGQVRMEWRRWWIFWRKHRAWLNDPASPDNDHSAQVHYMKGESHAALGATRWRWVEDDEQAWISCPRNSCCSVAP